MEELLNTTVADLSQLKYAVDTFYFLVCGALVMWMAAGFAMLEAGLVRARCLSQTVWTTTRVKTAKHSTKVTCSGLTAPSTEVPRLSPTITLSAGSI